MKSKAKGTPPVETMVTRRTGNTMQRQQLIAYLVGTGLVMVGMSLHLVNIIGAALPALRFLSIAAMVICAATFVLWIYRRVSVKRALDFTAIIVQAVQSAKIIYIAVGLPASYSYLIEMNGIISMMLMTLMAICYLRLACVGVSVANAVTLIFACFIIHQRILWEFVILIMLFSVFFVFMADMMYRNVKLIQDENTEYRKGEQRLLQLLRLNQKEIRAYVEMCRAENPNDADTDRLFGMLSERSQRNVINAVERKKALDSSRSKVMDEHLPGFTPMELEVARLIVRDMKLSQIIDYTGKSESNISVVRSRIRKKLGLEPGEDLRKALMKRLGEDAQQ